MLRRAWAALADDGRLIVEAWQGSDGQAAVASSGTCAERENAYVVTKTSA